MEVTRRSLIGALALLCTTLCAGISTAQQGRDRYITVASTTSTEHSDLFAYLLPIFGPKTDPAEVAGAKDVETAFAAIAAAKAPFVSRGDRSGTHAAELRTWEAA